MSTDDDVAVVRVLVRTYARHRGVSTWTVKRWIATGKLDGEKDEGGQRWWVIVKKNLVQPVATRKTLE